MRSWSILSKLIEACGGDPDGRGQPLPPAAPVTPTPRTVGLLELALTRDAGGIFDLDLVTGQMTGTPRFFELLELADQGALFTRDEWLATVHPQDLEGLIAALNAAVLAGDAFEISYRTLRLDAEPLGLWASGHVLQDTDGFPVRAVGVLTAPAPRSNLEPSS